jgi:endonuclease/exonuclease/phosphatase family metal-dependent hydrolase
VRLATFNVLHGRSLEDDRVDLNRFAAAVAAVDADVLALQEVDRLQERSHRADLTEVAAQALVVRR